uniref:Proprotein convertase subtilisin/kexin type 9 C-terminal domain-containing protein n=1 Tax=Monopterus albus TaxID=43700 RepID=A0A3Q3JEG2_MONAL
MLTYSHSFISAFHLNCMNSFTYRLLYVPCVTPQAAWRMPGQHLVILHQGTHECHVQKAIRVLRTRNCSGALCGFLVNMSSEGHRLKLSHVHYIEEDLSIFVQSAPWNLQRLLQPHGNTSKNRTYQPHYDGGMSSHREEDGVRVHRQATHAHKENTYSHNTHTPGVVSGLDSGVGKGTASGALAGMEFIQATLLARPVDVVVVLLPFRFSRSLDTACWDMVANRVVIIFAAGNVRDDTCLYSPASEPEVVTALNSVDQLIASSDCSTCFISCSRTSQAACNPCVSVLYFGSCGYSSDPVIRTCHWCMFLHYSISNTINLLSAALNRKTYTYVYGKLLCQSMWSERSGVTIIDRVVSHCRQGEEEEMMGCIRETISGRGKGVYAVPHCCVIGGLQCVVHADSGQDEECADPQGQRLCHRQSDLLSGLQYVYISGTENRKCSKQKKTRL